MILKRFDRVVSQPRVGLSPAGLRNQSS